MKVVKYKVSTDVEQLHKVSKDIDMSDKKLVDRLFCRLMGTYTELNGRLQGLSAIQLGEPYSAVLLRYVKGETPIIAFNPVVLKSIGRRKSNEGCISEPEHRYTVSRPRLLKVRYFNKDGETITKWLTYKKARIFMHEYDHTQGILLQDKGVIDDDGDLLFGKYRVTPDYKIVKVK